MSDNTVRIQPGEAFFAPLDSPVPFDDTSGDWVTLGHTSDPNAFSFQSYYDEETGTLGELVDGTVRTLAEVRAGLVEEHIEKAVIKELERKGYVILGPYT